MSDLIFIGITSRSLWRAPWRPLLRQSLGGPNGNPRGGAARGCCSLLVGGHAAAGNILRSDYGRLRLAPAGPVCCGAGGNHQAMGSTWCACSTQTQDLAQPRAASLGAADVRLMGRNTSRAGLEAIHAGDTGLQPGRVAVHLCPAASATSAAAQSARIRSAQRGPRLQHRGELHHQHQLAKLRRGIHPVVPLPDGRLGLPQFRVRRDRHCHRRRSRSRSCATLGQTLGNFGPTWSA